MTDNGTTTYTTEQLTEIMRRSTQLALLGWLKIQPPSLHPPALAYELIYGQVPTILRIRDGIPPNLAEAWRRGLLDGGFADMRERFSTVPAAEFLEALQRFEHFIDNFVRLAEIHMERLTESMQERAPRVSYGDQPSQAAIGCVSRYWLGYWLARGFYQVRELEDSLAIQFAIGDVARRITFAATAVLEEP